MDESLQSQSQRVADYILKYMEFVYELIDRSRLRRTALGLAMLKQTVDPLAPSEKIRAAASRVTTDEEKKHEYFEIMMSQNALDKLTAELFERFPGVDFNKLARFNALSAPKTALFDFNRLGGIAFMIMGAMMQFVPRLLDHSRLLDVWGVAFYFIGVSLIYPRWARRGLRRKISQRAMYVVEYAAIVSSNRS